MSEPQVKPSSQRTFSRPKNLSLPSRRTDPAFCNNFSNGVNSCGGSSFLDLSVGSLVAVEAPYRPIAFYISLDLGEHRARGLQRSVGRRGQTAEERSHATHSTGASQLLHEARHGSIVANVWVAGASEK